MCSTVSPEVFSFLYELLLENRETMRDTPFTDFLALSAVHCGSERADSSVALKEKLSYNSGILRERLKTTPESAIVAEMHAEMKTYLETSFSLDYHDSPHNEDESLKSISFPAGSDDLDPERQPSDLLIRCAALYSILREETDPLVVQIICWLPTILLQFELLRSFLTRRESLLKEAIAIWRWLLAEIPLLHVEFPRFSDLVPPDPRAELRVASHARVGSGDLPRVGLLARRSRPLVPRRSAPRAAHMRLSLPLQHGLRQAGPALRTPPGQVAEPVRSGRDHRGPAGRNPAAVDAAADRSAAAL